MIITPEFVCLHLQKCAGSFLREYMLQNIKNSVYTGEPHDKMSDIPKEHRYKPVVGTVRDTWEWYISWYAGTQRNPHGHFWVLHKNGKQTTFQQFMKTIFSLNKKVHNVDFGLINNLGIGVYTYRYIQSYCNNPRQIFNQIDRLRNIPVPKKLHLCSVGNLENDLMSFFNEIGYSLTQDQITRLKNMDRVNKSNHDRSREYYTSSIICEISRRDRLIVNNLPRFRKEQNEC